MKRYGRRNVKVVYNNEIKVILKDKKYEDYMWKVDEKKKVKVNMNVELVEVRNEKKEDVFKYLYKKDEKYVKE